MNYTDHPNYKRLPECVKQSISSKEYSWLTDKQREELIEKECLPEEVEE